MRGRVMGGGIVEVMVPWARGEAGSARAKFREHCAVLLASRGASATRCVAAIVKKQECDLARGSQGSGVALAWRIVWRMYYWLMMWPTRWRSLAKMLRECGHDVACVRNGLEALEALDDVTPDVVVTDIRMPVMDGMAFLRGGAVAESSGAGGGDPDVGGGRGDGAGRRGGWGRRRCLRRGGCRQDALLGAIEYWSGN